MNSENDSIKSRINDDRATYARMILNSLTAHVAIIDENGFIVDTNEAWKTFGLSNKIGMAPDTLGVNYLDVCDASLGENTGRSHDVSQGIRKIIDGEIKEFVIEYPCHGPKSDQKLWFYMRATRIEDYDPIRIVISHENITPLKLAEKALEKNAGNLEDVNAALRVMLRQRNEDKSKMEENIFQNIRQDILPLLEQIESYSQSPQAMECIALIRTALNEITSPLIRRLTNLETILTPGEIRIARLIKEGKSTKEIAALLNLSVTTVSFHRRNLRKKLKLKNSRINLRTHLLSLSL